MRMKSFSEILRGWFVYKLFTFDWIVENSQTLTRLSQKIFGRKLFEKFMKMTIYGHFVAGEEKAEVMRCVALLKTRGIRCVLDYSAEEDVSDEQKVSHEIRAKLSKTDNNITKSTDLQSAIKEFQTTEQTGKSVKRATARTYFYQDEIKCDKNRDIFMDCIKMAADGTEKGEGFAAIKVTALSNPKLLLKFSELVKLKHDLFLKLATEKTHQDSLFDTPGSITPESFSRGLAGLGVETKSQQREDMFKQLQRGQKECIGAEVWQDMYREETDLYKLIGSKDSTRQYTPTLKPERQQQYNDVVARLVSLAQHSQDLGVRLMIDAEQSYFQDAIHYITLHALMPQFNTQFPTIYNTHQCYVQIAHQGVCRSLEYAAERGFVYGLKLVRGAYMEQERTRSHELNYPDPILSDIEATHEMYHRVMEMCLSEVRRGKVKLMIASHNKDSIERTVQLMRRHEIPPEEGVVFGQLLGMCDYVSLPLSQAGYKVYKYTPYGPVKEVVPYLARRAVENRGMLKGADFERYILGQELKRRLFNRK